MTGPRQTKFYLDKLNAKWKGVCAGIANYTGIDVTLLRVATVLFTFLGSGALVLVYLIVGLMAPIGRRERGHETGDSPFRRMAGRGGNAGDVRSSFRELDRRLADVETYVTSSNTSLSREIEKLR